MATKSGKTEKNGAKGSTKKKPVRKKPARRHDRKDTIDKADKY